MIYYKVVGHLEDREQGTGTFVFNDEQPISYLKKMFSDNLLLNNDYDPDNIWEQVYPETYIDFIFRTMRLIFVSN